MNTLYLETAGEITPRTASEFLGHPDPYLAEIERVKAKEIIPVDPSETIILDVDNNQGAFRDDGEALKLVDGQHAYDLSKHNDLNRIWAGRIHTIDFHSDNNISFASQFKLPGMITSLKLNEHEEVMVHTLGREPYSFRDVDFSDSIHTYEDMKEYLEAQRDFRYFTSAILRTTVSGVEQTLWDDHANKESEREFISDLDDAEVVMNKGQFDKSDSYSSFIAGNGNPNMLTNNNGRGLEITDESAGARLSKMVEASDAKTIAVRGLASFHCDLFTVESMRTMQEVQIIEDRIRFNNENLTEIFSEMITHLLNQGVINPDQVDEYSEKFLGMYEKYNRMGLKLNPSIRIVFIVDESDPVRIPGLKEADQINLIRGGIEAYKEMGVEVIHSSHVQAA